MLVYTIQFLACFRSVILYFLLFFLPWSVCADEIIGADGTFDTTRKKSLRSWHNFPNPFFIIKRSDCNLLMPRSMLCMSSIWLRILLSISAIFFCCASPALLSLCRISNSFSKKRMR